MPDLKRWYRDDAARIAAGGEDLVASVSSATRVPGDLSVVWDGKSDTGETVPAGNYFLCVEGSREHGPYSIVREALQLAAAPFDKVLASAGELQNVSVKLVAR